jgi:hypothetical protein
LECLFISDCGFFFRVQEQLKHVYHPQSMPKCVQCGVGLPFVWSCMSVCIRFVLFLCVE